VLSNSYFHSGRIQDRCQQETADHTAFRRCRTPQRIGRRPSCRSGQSPERKPLSRDDLLRRRCESRQLPHKTIRMPDSLLFSPGNTTRKPFQLVAMQTSPTCVRFCDRSPQANRSGQITATVSTSPATAGNRRLTSAARSQGAESSSSPSWCNHRYPPMICCLSRSSSKPNPAGGEEIASR